MQVYELQTRFDARKSFYGKATVEANYPEVKLTSYTTHVASIKYDPTKPDDKGTPEVYGTYSQTTLRHIKEFLLQYGFRADNSKQIMADYGVTQ